LVDPNTRQGKRTPVTLKIKFKSETLEQFIERYAVDVSQGGIFIRTKEPLAVGTQMKFEFQLRDASPLIAGEGTVVWTRENDPSRPAIAPGMGVRFDRLADGSQGILERILAEKAKQAPQRPAADTTKPPLFTDTPTRVAPAPMQDALLGRNNGQRGGREDTPHGDSHTPLPKPIPFHTDADEFPDEAFEEATKVRALDELIAQTAEGGGQDELAGRRPNGRPEAARAESAMDRAETRPMGDGHEPPDLPTPPELGALGRPPPKMLDTSPSPRIDPPMGSPLGSPMGSSLPAAESPAKTRLGLEPARARVSTPPSYPPPLSLPLDPQGPQGPSIGHAILESASMSSGMRALPSEQTQPARLPPIRPRSSAPIVILLLLLVAGAGAAVWFLVLRPRTTADSTERVTGSSQPGSATTPGSGAVASGTATPGSAAAPVGSGAPAEIAETVISAGVEGASVEISGAGQTGPAPFTARLEKGKPYKARISAHGYATLEVEIKGGDPNRSATLIAKPRVLSIDSDPSGAVILVDSGTTGHTTPFDIELTPAQAQKKSIRVQLRKTGYRALDRTVDLGKLAEEDTRMIAKLSEKLAPAPPITRTGPNAGTGKGSDTAGTGSDTTAPANGSAEGSGSSPGPVTSPSGATGTTPPPPPPSGATTGSSGSAAEPEPDFTKPKN
jgi:uncharacterized protein (TIGR02266 family)